GADRGDVEDTLDLEVGLHLIVGHGDLRALAGHGATVLAQVTWRWSGATRTTSDTRAASTDPRSAPRRRAAPPSWSTQAAPSRSRSPRARHRPRCGRPSPRTMAWAGGGRDRSRPTLGPRRNRRPMPGHATLVSPAGRWPRRPALPPPRGRWTVRRRPSRPPAPSPRRRRRVATCARRRR